LKTQIVLDEGAGAETLKKEQTGTLAENKGIIAIGYLRCPGLARAIHNIYTVSSLQSTGGRR